MRVSSAFPLPHHAPAGFAAATSVDEVGEAIASCLTDHATIRDLRPNYLRYKGGDGVVVGWRVSLELDAGQVEESYVTVRVAPRARLRAELERYRERAGKVWCGLRAAALHEDSNLLLCALPVDRELRGLGTLVRASRVRELLSAHAAQIVPPGYRISKRQSSFQLVRYKPERRAVLRWSLGLVAEVGGDATTLPIYARAYAGGIPPAVALALPRLTAAGVRVPLRVGTFGGWLAFESEVPGTAVEAPGGDRAAAMAELLVRLHRTPPTPQLRLRSVEAELAAVARIGNHCAQLATALGVRIHDVVAGLARSRPADDDVVFLHGDLHREQFVFDRSRAGLVDFDRVCAGSPCIDVASVRAHALLEGASVDGLAGFADAYAAAGGRAQPRTLAWWTACALLRVVMQPFRRLEPDWPDRCAALVEQARAHWRAAVR